MPTPDSETTTSLLRQIPSVDRLIQAAAGEEGKSPIASEYLTLVARDVQTEARNRIRAGEALHSDHVEDLMRQRLGKLASGSLKPIVNGTGVIIHTNLGRAPVSQETARAMADAASHYVPLEVNLESGNRGGRGSEVSEALQYLTGAEAALVVNNNAAAVNIVLSALAHGQKVVVSRAEAVEIGGGFRIPDVLRQSGATLTEVGTTNRTRVSDYEDAIDEDTAALMKVHASNFVILGFTAHPSISEIVNVAHAHKILAIEDMGSGCLIDPRQFGLGAEPLLTDSIGAGADVVTASGDKLLGGPQAGIILGKKQVIDRIASHPLARALRVDKTVQAGLVTTLRHYLRGEATETIPIWWSISRDLDWLRSRAVGWAEAIGDARVSTVRSESVVGGGSLPGRTLESIALAINLPHQAVDTGARYLRTAVQPIHPRIQDGAILIDARTVLAGEDEIVVHGVRQMLGQIA